MAVRKQPRPVFKRRNVNENTTKSDGAHLGPGSSEYREMLRDRQGLDEKEQRNAKLEEMGHRGDSDFKKEDEWHEAEAKEAAGIASGMYRSFEEANHNALTPTQRSVSYQIRKGVKTKATMANAERIAEGTESPDDDKFVERKMPKILEKEQYNDGVTEDDYYPGSKLINKYL